MVLEGQALNKQECSMHPLVGRRTHRAMIELSTRLGTSLRDEQSYKLGREKELVGWKEACMTKDTCV